MDLDNKKTRYEKYNRKQKQPEEIKKLDYYFKKIEDLKKIKNNIKGLSSLYKKMIENNIDDWLLKYEFLSATNCNRNLEWIDNMYIDLEKEASKKSDLSRAIKRGLNLFV